MMRRLQPGQMPTAAEWNELVTFLERWENQSADPSTGIEFVRTGLGPPSMRLPPRPVQVVEADASTPDPSTPGYFDGSVALYNTATGGNPTEREKCWIYPVTSLGTSTANSDVIIRVTSTTLTSGLFPAFVETCTNPDGNPPTWSDGAACWAVGVAGCGLVPQRYLGSPVGHHSDGKTVYVASQPVAVVRVSSGTVDSTSHMYPGFVQKPTDGTPVTLADGVACWIYGPNAETLTTQKYDAVFAIIHSDGKPVYEAAVPGASGSLTVTTPSFTFSYQGPTSVPNVNTINCGFGQTNAEQGGPATTVEITYSGWMLGLGASDAVQVATGNEIPWKLAPANDSYDGATNIPTPFLNANDFIATPNTSACVSITPVRVGLYLLGTQVNFDNTSTAAGTYRKVSLVEVNSGNRLNQVTQRTAIANGKITSMNLTTCFLVDLPSTYAFGVFMENDSGSNIDVTGSFWGMKLG